MLRIEFGKPFRRATVYRGPTNTGLFNQLPSRSAGYIRSNRVSGARNHGSATMFGIIVNFSTPLCNTNVYSGIDR